MSAVEERKLKNLAEALNCKLPPLPPPFAHLLPPENYPVWTASQMVEHALNVFRRLIKPPPAESTEVVKEYFNQGPMEGIIRAWARSGSSLSLSNEMLRDLCYEIDGLRETQAAVDDAMVERAIKARCAVDCGQAQPGGHCYPARNRCPPSRRDITTDEKARMRAALEEVLLGDRQ